jgi:uncharacterized RDD family membrane protein YckC
MLAGAGTLVNAKCHPRRDISVVVRRESSAMNDSTNPYAPPRAIVSDVLIDDDLEPAGRAIRLAAAILDAILILFALYAPLIIAAAVGGTGGGDPATYSTVAGLSMLFITLGFLGITIFYVARDGQTLAKKWLGIKVIRTDGTKASLGRIFALRNLISWVLAFTFIYSIVDALFIFGEDRQCLHDKMADTVVVVA